MLLLAKKIKKETLQEQQEARIISTIKETGINIEKDVKLIDLETYFKGRILRRKDFKK